MSRLSKRMKEAQKAIGIIERPLPLQEAVNRLAKAPKVKFDETVELHFNLNLDLKASDQGVRGTVVLPHGIGKKVRVAALPQPRLWQPGQIMSAILILLRKSSVDLWILTSWWLPLI